MLNLVIAMLMAATAASTDAATVEAQPVDSAQASGTEQPAQTQDGQQPAAKPKKICKKIPGETGTRTSDRKLCMTAAQWKKYYSE